MYILLYIKLFKNLNITGSSTKKKKTDLLYDIVLFYKYSMTREFLITSKQLSNHTCTDNKQSQYSEVQHITAKLLDTTPS